jgi:indolepyruvate ferredoxin oxidoreductase beta subunit
MSHVRWGTVVHSPLVGAGEADVYLAFEKAEALRNLNQLRAGALAVINLQAIEPITVTSGGQPYPDDDRLRAKIAEVTDKAVYVDGECIAGELGNVRAANVVLLGVLSALMEQAGLAGPELTPEVWLKVIEDRVPAKYVELNRRAFQAGRAAIS